MSRVNLIDVFNQVQKSTSCHQNYLQVTHNLFKSVPFDDFLCEFRNILHALFCQPLGHNVDNINRCFSFCAKFCGIVAVSRSGQHDDDHEMHPFITEVVKHVLKYQDLADERGRCYSCQFISVMLKEVGEDANLDSHLCDYIQDAMLERITDGKPTVRLQAVNALMRLQDPSYSNCLVIKAFIQGLGDPSAVVRRAIVQNIAASRMTLRHIIKRLRDVDHNVRQAAFSKCVMIGPKLMKIEDRQMVMMAGISEDNNVVKKMFSKVLLPKWLSDYDNDYIKFMNALRLDADENDIKQTVYIYEKLLDMLLKSEPLKDLVQALHLDENKLLPQEEVSVASVFYWYYLLRFFDTKIQDDDCNVTPDLTSLCSFIESFIRERTSKELNDWEYLEQQQILLRLFQMAGRANLSDEFGRQALHKLIVKTMQKTKLEGDVLARLVIILQKFLPDTERLAGEVCMIISEVREPLEDQGPNEGLLHDMAFKKAEIRVKLNVLKHEQEEAVRTSDFQAAARIQVEMEAFKLKEKELLEEFETVNKVVRVQDDPEAIARALDILIALLQVLSAQKKIPVSLRSCMNEFVTPLVVSTNPSLHWRVLKCVVLFSLMNREVALKYLKYISSPILIYRLASTYDKPTLLTSVCAISDLLRVYGKGLFNRNETTGDQEEKERDNVRHLYKLSASKDINSFDINSITCEDLIDIILDMLDDEVQEIRENAAIAISMLVYTGLMVCSSLLLRLFLKWFNPMSEKYDQKIQQVLGASIVHFAEHVKGSAEILEKTIIPTLCSIGNAPHTSPLAEVDVDNVLRFLAAVTKIKRNCPFDNGHYLNFLDVFSIFDDSQEFSETHQNLSYAILAKIKRKSREQYVPLLVNMLLCLDKPKDSEIVIDELAKEAEDCLKVVTDKAAVKSLNKYMKKLTGQALDVTNLSRYSSLLDTTVANADGNTSVLKETVGHIRDSAKKRKQLRTIREATPLPTVPDNHVEEDNFGREEVCIETPTSESSSSQDSVSSFNKDTSVNRVVPETPSESSGDSGKCLRRSKRKVMKTN